MNNDQINELLSLMGQQIKEHAGLRADTDRRFVQLTEVMVNGFLRLEDKLGARIDNVVASVNHLTEEVQGLKTEMREVKIEVRELKTEMREVKTDVREIKVQNQETNRRLVNTFDQVGGLTEQTESSQLRLAHVEAAQQPTNAELDARLRVLENQPRKAS